MGSCSSVFSVGSRGLHEDPPGVEEGFRRKQLPGGQEPDLAAVLAAADLWQAGPSPGPFPGPPTVPGMRRLASPVNRSPRDWPNQEPMSQCLRKRRAYERQVLTGFAPVPHSGGGGGTTWTLKEQHTKKNPNRKIQKW